MSPFRPSVESFPGTEVTAQETASMTNRAESQAVASTPRTLNISWAPARFFMGITPPAIFGQFDDTTNLYAGIGYS